VRHTTGMQAADAKSIPAKLKKEKERKPPKLNKEEEEEVTQNNRTLYVI